MEYNPNTKTMESSKKNLGVTEEIIWNKLVQINEELHNRKDWNGSFSEQHMCEMIIKKLELLGNIFTEENVYDLYTIIFFSSHRDNDVKFTLKEFNKLYDNLTKDEWNFLIECIMNY